MAGIYEGVQLDAGPSENSDLADLNLSNLILDKV